MRIFMFIDMKDSTSHAETLGHLKFTELIQDCFSDFGKIALKRDVEIYQYIGDEVVVSWFIKNGVRNQNCLNLFMEFRQKIEARKDHYLKEFGIFPVFKSGGHIGEVTVAEIGHAKRGIEYLSDVLNTSARIQSLCNYYETDFLISGELNQTLGNKPGFTSELIEKVRLKGKKQKVEIFKVSKAK